MNTRIVKIDPLNIDQEIIGDAGKLIRDGKLVAFPTETVYGLGASAYNADAALNVFKAKGRPADNPLIVHIANLNEVENIAYTNELFYKLASKFMPGPLTIILKKKDIIPDSVTAGLDSVAVRYPSNKIANALIKAAGVPIAAPSANKSGRPSPTIARHVIEDMNGEIEMIIDGGDADFGLESTVIKLDGDDGCVILRPGAVTDEMLATVCRSVKVAEAVIDPNKVGDKPLSPGMKYKHYAPKAELYLIDSKEEEFKKFVISNGDSKTAILCPKEDEKLYSNMIPLVIGNKGDTLEYCHRLFTLLREADEKGANKIYATLPKTKGEELAIYNRIIRAAGCKVIKL